jgi:hypothetical protein
MLATLTDVEVMPVWSLNALAGMPDPPPLPEVVFDEDEVELQATALVATSMTIPRAARRVFPDANPTVPPYGFVLIGTVTVDDPLLPARMVGLYATGRIACQTSVNLACDVVLGPRWVSRARTTLSRLTAGTATRQQVLLSGLRLCNCSVSRSP